MIPLLEDYIIEPHPYALSPFTRVPVVINDGGRSAEGFPNCKSDCVMRSVAIASGLPFGVVRSLIMHLDPLSEEEGTAVNLVVFKDLMIELGFSWVPALEETYICELPKGRIIVDVPEHYTAVMDGVINDLIDSSAFPIRGYWVFAPGNLFNVCKNGKAVNSYPMNLTAALTMQRLYKLNYNTKTFIL